ncbi:MAG: hypothetical protein FJX52_09495, partial [Alphaproteobacteria bacterium]|nr:hypothetical protein [Alphaproteobacteria bacterium]
MSATISDEYRELQLRLHRERDDYGSASRQWAGYVAQIIDQHKITNLLDYGAGKQRLGQELKGLLAGPVT